MSTEAELRDAWAIEPGDLHAVEPRYSRQSWWFQNQRGDSLHVTPDDVVSLLDLLAGPRTDDVEITRCGDHYHGFRKGHHRDSRPWEGVTFPTHEAVLEAVAEDAR